MAKTEKPKKDKDTFLQDYMLKAFDKNTLPYGMEYLDGTFKRDTDEDCKVINENF